MLGWLAVVVILVYMWRRLRADPHMVLLARNIPGPKTLPFIGNLRDISKDGEDALKRRMEFVEKYGSVVRFWVGNLLIVLLDDPNDVEMILGSSIHIEKSDLYDILHPWLGSGLVTSSGKKWFNRRKVITPAFHFKILEEFVEVFNKNGDILVDRLKSRSDSVHFDVQPFISRFALDVICETAMGTEIKAQSGSSSDYVEAVRRICELTFYRLLKPWFRNEFLFRLSGMWETQKNTLEILHGMTNQVIKDKMRDLENGNLQLEEEIQNEEKELGVKKKVAFLELLLRSSRKNKEIFKTSEDLREEVDTFMFAGHDTTTAGVCFTLYNLAKYQDIQEKAYQELNDLGISENLTYQNLLDMKYLERVIKESLRLFPVVPGINRKLFKDVTINSGYTIPAGCVVGISMFSMHRDKKNFPNPLEFNPDNFLPENCAKRHPYAFIPFSAGPRNCIGQKYAMLEMKASLAKILTNYEVGYAGKEWDVRPYQALVLQSKNGFNIKLTSRN